MFYLIVSEYVGPNKLDSTGAIIGDSAVASITTECGRTNMSREKRSNGWLGTTNDNSVTAHGEFDTIDEARGAAATLGYTQPYEPDENEYDSAVVEQWVSESAARDQWDAGNWFLNGLGSAGTCAAYGITADTTDDELAAAADVAETEAIDEQNAELHGTFELFAELRDELRESEWCDADTRKRIIICSRIGISIFAARREQRPALVQLAPNPAPVGHRHL